MISLNHFPHYKRMKNDIDGNAGMPFHPYDQPEYRYQVGDRVVGACHMGHPIYIYEVISEEWEGIPGDCRMLAGYTPPGWKRLCTLPRSQYKHIAGDIIPPEISLPKKRHCNKNADFGTASHWPPNVTGEGPLRERCAEERKDDYEQP